MSKTSAELNTCLCHHQTEAGFEPLNQAGARATHLASCYEATESGKQQIKEVRKKKFNRKTREQRQLLGESGFVLRIAPPSLSRDRRIKMKKSECYACNV